MKEPRIYKNSPATLILIAVVFIILIVGITVGAVVDPTLMVLVCAFGLLSFGIVFLSVTSQAILSDDEITSKTILGARTLRWTEITRASGSGNKIKLHNEDTTVTINSQPPGYEEIVEIIGQKRADLFSPQEFGEMRRSIGSYFGSFFIFLMFAGIAVFYFTSGAFSSDSLISMVFIAVFLLVFLVSFFTSPQSLTLENNNLQVKYLLSEKNYTANEVASIFLAHTRTRKGGKQYFISLNTKDGKNMRISRLNVGLPITYLVLKNWHKKFSS